MHAANITLTSRIGVASLPLGLFPSPSCCFLSLILFFSPVPTLVFFPAPLPPCLFHFSPDPPTPCFFPCPFPLPLPILSFSFLPLPSLFFWVTSWASVHLSPDSRLAESTITKPFILNCVEWNVNMNSPPAINSTTTTRTSLCLKKKMTRNLTFQWIVNYLPTKQRQG